MIENSVTKDFYIGSCIYPLQRSRRHMRDLKKNRHQNPILQRAFNKYGIENFEFKIIRKFLLGEVSRNSLYKVEQQYIDTMNPLYNIARIVDMPPELSKENREKLTNLVSLDWIVTNPNGQETKIRNLARFCRENKLEKRCMQYIAYGKMNSHKGWKCRKASDTHQLYKNKFGKTYKITCVDGSEIIVKNLAKFCIENNLSRSKLMNKKKFGIYKNFKSLTKID